MTPVFDIGEQGDGERAPDLPRPIPHAERPGYWQLLLEDLRSYQREGLLAQGFWAMRIHRFSAATRGLRFAPLRVFAKILHRLASKIGEIVLGIYIGANARIGRRCVIEHFGAIIIHSDAEIGDDVTIRQGVTIGIKSAAATRDAPVIGDRVDIGAGAKLIGKIRIGDDVVIGANAVVLTDVPARSIAVGVPATIRPRRDKER